MSKLAAAAAFTHGLAGALERLSQATEVTADAMRAFTRVERVTRELQSKGRANYGAIIQVKVTLQETESMNYYDLLGFHIHVVNDTPKRQLSADVSVTPEFRAEYDRWLLSFFGYHNDLADGQVYLAGRDAWMNPRTFADYSREMKGRELREGMLGYLGGM